MIYADYSYYTQNYFGTAISEDDFPRFALRASSYLDYYTHGKAALNSGLDALKMACCALAEQYGLIEIAQLEARKIESDGTELKSQSVGEWSQTYATAAEKAGQSLSIARNAEKNLANIAQRYLLTTGLLYRG